MGDPRRWAVLVRPSANRVYAGTAAALLEAEAGVLAATLLAGRIGEPRTEQLGGASYLVLDTDGDLSAADRAHLSTLSSLYTLHELLPGGLLRPVAPAPCAVLDDDLLTIPKYAGKTNELFTRMLLNLTVWAAGRAPAVAVPGDAGAPPRVLDPVSGRGTTLHQALLYGCEADGIEIDERDVDAHAAFLRTWLRRKRLKHTAELVPINRDGRRLGRRLDVELARDKDAWKAGDRLRLSVANADTRRAAELFRAGRHDVVVADLPYGVQHGSRSGAGLSRGPLDLLREALPGWLGLLRPGGALGLAWNTHVAPRSELVELLGGAGLEPFDTGPWLGLRHRVDQAIDRDVVVARRPA